MTDAESDTAEYVVSGLYISITTLAYAVYLALAAGWSVDLFGEVMLALAMNVLYAPLVVIRGWPAIPEWLWYPIVLGWVTDLYLVNKFQ